MGWTGGRDAQYLNEPIRDDFRLATFAIAAQFIHSKN